MAYKVPTNDEIFTYVEKLRAIPGVEDFLEEIPPPFAAMLFASTMYCALGECKPEHSAVISLFVSELLDQFKQRAN